MKVSIRPPKVTADNQCFDDDRLNIKFVSNFVDIPDNQEADETTSDKAKTKSKQKGKDGKQTEKGTKAKKGAKDKSSQRGAKDQASKAAGGSQNKNKSARKWSPSASEQSELESSYDDIEDTRGMSNSNKRTSRTWWRYGSSNVYFDEESSQSNQPMSSSNDEEEDPVRNLNISTDLDSEKDTAKKLDVLTNMDKEQSDEHEEQEIVLLYGQIRQIIRGPTANDPDDVQHLPNVVVAEAEKDKETLCPLMVVTDAPPVIDPVGVDEQYKMATVSWLDDSGREDGYGRSSRTTTPSVRSEASRQAGRAAYARAAKMKPYKTRSDDHDRKPLSTKTSTNDVIATPSLTSARQVRELRDSVDDVSETSSTDEKGLVVARRTTPLYSRGTSPWLIDQSSTDDHSKGRAPPPPAAAAARPPPSSPSTPAAAAAEMSDSVSSSLSDVPPRQYSQRQRQQQKHHVPVKRQGRDATTSSSRLPPPNMAEMLSELEYMMAHAIAAELPLKAAVEKTKRRAVANVTTESSMSLPPVLPTSVPPSQLAPCLKYRSAAAGPSATSQAANPQRRRRIRFASEVKQRTLV